MHINIYNIYNYIIRVYTSQQTLQCLIVYCHDDHAIHADVLTQHPSAGMQLYVFWAYKSTSSNIHAQCSSYIQLYKPCQCNS